MPSLATFVWADVCSRLGLGDRAGEFYELLEPFSQPARGHGCLRVGREVALGLLVALQGGASRPRAQGIDPAAEIEERFGAPPWPRSAVAGTTDSTAGFAWIRARRRAPLTLLDRTRRGPLCWCWAVDARRYERACQSAEYVQAGLASETT